MRSFLAGISFVLLYAGCALAVQPAGSHLEPMLSSSGHPWDDGLIVGEVFKEAYRENVRARVQISGTLVPQDDMLFLTEDKNEYRVHVLKSPVLLAEYSHGAITSFGPPKNGYKAIKLARCDAHIPSSLGQQIVTAWRVTLLRTRFDEVPRRGLDGGWEEFSMSDKYQELEGRTWSPEDGTEAGRLSAIAGTLLEFCDSKKESLLRNLQSGSAELIKIVQSEEKQ